jgi:hypothetical protein
MAKVFDFLHAALRALDEVAPADRAGRTGS